MNETKNSSIWGFNASVYIKYDGDIHSLAKLLSKGLLLPDFTMDTDQDPPHEWFGACEVLRLDVTIHGSTDNDYKFLFEVETENSLDELYIDRMHNLSLWFAKQISAACEIETRVLTENEIVASFFKGKRIERPPL
jgi:hypothetical protein